MSSPLPVPPSSTLIVKLPLGNLNLQDLQALNGYNLCFEVIVRVQKQEAQTFS